MRLHHQDRSISVARRMSFLQAIETARRRCEARKEDSTHLLQSLLTLWNEAYIDARSIRVCITQKEEITGEPVAVRCFREGRSALVQRVYGIRRVAHLV